MAPLACEVSAMTVIQILANVAKTMPDIGTFSANKMPPKKASEQAQSAVVRTVAWFKKFVLGILKLSKEKLLQILQK